MHIADTDLLLINTNSNSQSFKITALKLKESLAPNLYNNYKLLVNKPDYSSRFVYAQNMQASVAPTDYMLVERSGVSYKVTGDHIIDYFPAVPAGAAGAIVAVAPIVETSRGWDQSLRWQDYITEEFGGVSGLNDLFNGRTDLFTNPKNPGRGEWTPPTPIPCSKVKVLVRPANPGGNNINALKINGVGYADQVPSTYLEEKYIEVAVSELVSVEWSAGVYTGPGVSLSAIWYDDILLVNYGVAGAPISYDQQLTLAGDTNLDLFTIGDAVRMVNEDGEVDTYPAQSTAITSIQTLSGWNQDQTWTNGGGGAVTNGSYSSPFTAGDIYAESRSGRPSGFYINIGSGIVALNKLEVACWSEREDLTKLIINQSIVSNTIIPKTSATLPGARVEVRDITFPLTVSSIGLTGGGAGDDGRIYAVYVDGRRLVDPSHSSASLDPEEDPSQHRLIFASGNDDLEIINNKGVIAQPGSYNTQTELADNTEAFFRSDNGTTDQQIFNFYSGNDQFSNMPNFRCNGGGLKFNDPLIVNSSLKLRITGESGTLMLNSSTTVNTVNVGINTGPVPTLSSQPPWNDVTSSIPSFPFELHNIGIHSSDGGGAGNGSFWVGMEIDGVTVRGGTTEFDVLKNLEIQQCDVSSNTLTLPNSGSWSATNGDAVGTAGQRQSIVAVDVAGAGTITNISGSVVSLTNVVDGFVPDSNRLSTPFFIKSASTRTGLAVLRAKAIAISNAWASGTNYNVLNFVQHDGRYWVALADNNAITPATASAATWIDLGAI